MGCDSPLKGWKDRDTGGIVFRREMGYGEKMEVGCGQCLGCRLDYSRMWAMRIVHESSLYEYTGGNCFVTLTYRDKKDCDAQQLKNEQHVPDNWSLNKSHMRNFFKRLRKYFPDQQVRYFYAGEYGKKCQHGIDLSRVKCPMCNCGRPHYHVCLFNASFLDLEAYQSDGGIIRYTSPALERLWGYGFVDVGELNYSSANYTAKYILKKVVSVNSLDHYQHFDLNGEITWIEPEYTCMSRGSRCKVHKALGYLDLDCPNCQGGIGAKWYRQYKDDVFPSDEVPIVGDGVMKGVPRFYDEICKKENPEMFEKVKAKRQAYLKANSDELTYSRLLQKHKCKKARVKLSEDKRLV